MQGHGFKLRRIHLPGTSVNKYKTKGRGAAAPMLLGTAGTPLLPIAPRKHAFGLRRRGISGGE
jgi:hypothetical protein